MTWRDHIKVHPAADLFPMMSESELLELGEDIKKNGQKVQIIFFSEDGPTRPAVLIDGRNRLDAMELVGLPIHDEDGHPAFSLRFMDGDPYDLVLSLNINRRHLTSEQKRELIDKVLKAKPEQSDAAIAKQTKTSDKTVAKRRRKLESTSEIPRLEKTVGKDGKKRGRPPSGRPDWHRHGTHNRMPPRRGSPAAKRSILNSAEPNMRRSIPSPTGRLLLNLMGALSARPAQSGMRLWA